MKKKKNTINELEQKRTRFKKTEVDQITKNTERLPWILIENARQRFKLSNFKQLACLIF